MDHQHCDPSEVIRLTETSKHLMLIIHDTEVSGESHTSVFTLEKRSGRVVFTHRYEKVAPLNDARPRVVSFNSPQISLFPGEQLYRAALLEMSDTVRQSSNYADGSACKDRACEFVKKIEPFLFRSAA